MFAAPYATGLTKDAAGEFAMSLLAVVLLPFLYAIVVLIPRDDPALDRGILLRDRPSTEPD